MEIYFFLIFYKIFLFCIDKINATGRKRKSPDGRVSFSVSCTKEELELLKQIAKEKNMTLSGLIIYSVIEYNNSGVNDLL